ncbi:hypothetical protein LTR48_004147 [Friedmanniomyces endolithicus]|uniref:Acyl-CoA oxidase C-terminal domain-containing protein n=1 Tax=Rachicladosporium monterosium TaxID=1507873 RepID=A0ABR0L7Y1_9PEZI|nr:hypothetical protein LTR48_004147 [Friedmanniomyces endolithicus]KAK5144866.1 hypothetical protein LTR32_003277 [Rachicladosporium monterosium]
MASLYREATRNAGNSDEGRTKQDRFCMQINHAAMDGNLGTVVQIFDDVAKEAPAGKKHPLIQQLRDALLTAVESRRHDIAGYLIRKGVVADPSHGKSATINRDVAMLELLLQGGWDINEAIAWDDPSVLADRYLNHISWRLHSRAVEDVVLTDWFLLNGADPNARCGVDLTPLSVAVRDAPLATIRKLFEHGGSVASG